MCNANRIYTQKFFLKTLQEKNEQNVKNRMLEKAQKIEKTLGYRNNFSFFRLEKRPFCRLQTLKQCPLLHV